MESDDLSLRLPDHRAHGATTIRRIWLAIVLAGATVFSAALWSTSIIGRREASPASGAAALPTACQNFAEASAQVARTGSAAVLAVPAGYLFGRDPRTASRELLMDLLDACDAELASARR